PDPDQLQKALKLLRSAKRPLILAGRGVEISGARTEVLALAEKVGAPIAMTLLALGTIPASHPLALGMMGMHGEAWTNQAIQEADLLLAFGMRFDDRVTGDLRTYAPHARKIHVEVDPSEINKNVRVDVPILGDLRETLRVLLPQLKAQERPEWLARVKALRAGVDAEAILVDHGSLRAPQVFHDLWEATGGEATIVTDVGQHQMWEAQYYKHDAPRSLITSGGLGTMGFALPAAIGAKLARPGQEIWAVAGDGGFQMNVQELMTLVQEGLKVNLAVINNGYLGMVRQWQELFYQGRYAFTPMLSPDFVKLAAAFGIPGRRVTARAQVAEAVAEARQAPGPFLIEFQVEQETSVYPMVPTGASLHHMLRRGSAGAQS
ncbi:MAG TPA: thiamine pyrophosphate-dependent enzyme, partial [Holophaga sp.]|nr:thiamine pyrophosphate-dependent enzyme [Holophaga sp.]